MGFFSSIVSFVKNVVSSILNAIASLFQQVFGSPIVAALAIFVIAFIIMGPAAFAGLLENPWLFLVEHPVLSAIAANALTAVASLVCPDLGRALGYVVGIISFIVTGMNAYTLLANGTWTGTSLMVAYLGTAFDLSSQVLFSVFEFLTVWSALSFFSELAAGPDSPYLVSFVDGLFAIPTAAAELADVVVDGAISGIASVFDGLVPIIAFGIGAYFLLREKPTIVDGRQNLKEA